MHILLTAQSQSTAQAASRKTLAIMTGPHQSMSLNNAQTIRAPTNLRRVTGTGIIATRRSNCRWYCGATEALVMQRGVSDESIYEDSCACVPGSYTQSQRWHILQWHIYRRSKKASLSLDCSSENRAERAMRCRRSIPRQHCWFQRPWMTRT